MNRFALALLTLVLVGCGQPSEEERPAGSDTPAQEMPSADAPAPTEPAEAEPPASPSGRLEQVLAEQSEEVQSRYPHRHPQETLEFFGIEPGMTVVEVLPGGGWYTRILVPYLGADGRLIGANYPHGIWAKFGMMDESQIEAMATWPEDWPEQAREWQGSNGAAIDAFELGQLPESLEGQADAVLLIRALHNLARFEAEGGYLSTSLNDLVGALKPGGIVGVVQHEARADMPDEWAGGQAGYLKKQWVIDRMTEAGLELVDESDVNANPNDQPTTDDIVWRLPPSHATSADDEERRAEMDAIGESNRMTLKFRKPED